MSQSASGQVCEVEIKSQGEKVICDFCYRQTGSQISVTGFSCRGSPEIADCSNPDLVNSARQQFEEQIRQQFGNNSHFNYELLTQHFLPIVAS